jgi:hypothetical protein
MSPFEYDWVVGGDPEALAALGLSRFSAFRQPRRWGVALAVVATIVTAAPSVATAAAPSRQGWMPSSGYRGDELPPPHKAHLPPPQKPRPPPSHAEITKVVGENRSSITVCYQRALARDDSLTYGKITVKLSIGISGRVKHVSIDGLLQVRSLLEPCIREAVSRWIFPQASDEYGTEFPFVLQNDVDGKEPADGCAISVDTVPWSEIWIDGKNTTRLTPVADWKLPCGKHELTFKRPDLNIDRTETIIVRPRKKFRQMYALTADD